MCVLISEGEGKEQQPSFVVESNSTTQQADDGNTLQVDNKEAVAVAVVVNGTGNNNNDNNKEEADPHSESDDCSDCSE